MQRALRTVFLLLLAALSGCHDRPPPPGYTGPIVGDVARGALHSISGRAFHDRDGVFGGGKWTVGQLAVTPLPNEPSKKGPYVRIVQDGRSIVLPMEADGDAADLYRRVVGTAHEHLTTSTSEPYRRALARAQAK